jgi:acid stress chaperone HdeB
MRKRDRYESRAYLHTAAAGLAITFLTLARVEAQETIDITKITCDQFLAGKVTDSRTLSIWLSGFYSGSRGNTIVDPNAMGEKALIEYCIGHSEMSVLDAARNTVSTVK